VAAAAEAAVCRGCLATAAWTAAQTICAVRRLRRTSSGRLTRGCGSLSAKRPAWRPRHSSSSSSSISSSSSSSSSTIRSFRRPAPTHCPSHNQSRHILRRRFGTRATSSSTPLRSTSRSRPCGTCSTCLSTRSISRSGSSMPRTARRFRRGSPRASGGSLPQGSLCARRARSARVADERPRGIFFFFFFFAFFFLCFFFFFFCVFFFSLLF
jgi:hypothetical protein